MPITTRTALLGFFLALAALTVPGPAQAALAPAAAGESAAVEPSPPGRAEATIEQRLRRISAAIRERQGQAGDAATDADQRLAYGFANGGRGGFANGARGGFANAHPYYGGGGGFRNGGGGFANARYGGGFVNGGPYRGGVFRNW